MAISETDLKLLKSERMTDFSDGGGKMTGAEVVDGQVNNVFNDISQLDRTYGRVSLRKVFAVVQTANTDTYLGAHIILTDPPDDPNVNVTLFSTESWTDERDAARNRIESYSIEGPEAPWSLYGDHVVGQKMLMLWSRSNANSLTAPSGDEAPEVGDIMMLSVEKAGLNADFQFVRLTKIVSRTTEKFTDGQGDFFKDVLVLEISNPLRYLFKGATPSRYTLSRTDPAASPTLFRRTSVADAADYFGVKKILAPLALNDLTVEIGSPYSALVPSATAETPLVDVQANLARPNYVQSGDAASLTVPETYLSGVTAPDYAASLYLGRGFLPGGLALTIDGAAYVDNGGGGLVLANGTAGTYGGTADYATGRVTITKASAWSGYVTAAATPAVAVYDNAGTLSIPVTVNNRAFNYVKTLTPIPAPGSLIVDYKALDKWYRLYDDGQGHLAGLVDGIGSGTVNYATGSVMVTLAAMPDVDSAIIFAWSTPADYTQQTYVGQQPAPAVKGTLVNVPVQPGTLTISWTDGTAKSVTAAADGTISGDGTGRIVHATGEWILYPDTIPPSGTVFNLDYQQSLAKQDTLNVTGDAGGVINFTLTQTPIKPGSVSLSLNVNRYGAEANFTKTDGSFASVGDQAPLVIQDDGLGGWIGYTGTINYATGACSVDVTKTRAVEVFAGYADMHSWAAVG
jgi:hypothetical protein